MGGGGVNARTWTIAFPAGQKLLNANDRLHWGAKRPITRQLRTDAFKLAKAAKIPRLERARIDCTYEPPDRRRRDSANWSDTAKPLVDGLVDAGVLDDDDHTRVDGPFMHIGDVHARGRIVLEITELEVGE
jgi:crossover junction endodeoxyribonuclease RusA